MSGVNEVSRRKESPTCLPGAEWKSSQCAEQAEGSGPGQDVAGGRSGLLVLEGMGEDFYSVSAFRS